MSKLTTINERFKLLFRVDAYNLTNHPNFANPLAVAFFADAAPNRSGAFPTGIAPVTTPQNTAGQSIGNLAITATSDVGLGNPVLGGGGQRSIQFAAETDVLILPRAGAEFGGVAPAASRRFPVRPYARDVSPLNET